DYDNRLRMQGLDLKTYFQYTGMDLDSLRAQLRPQAEKQVKMRLALEKIAALENLTATDEDIEAELQRIADAYQMKIEDVRNAIPTDSVAEDIKVKKAMDLVKEKAITK
ncbi:MAG: trigger factor, partial [Clostridia bacterium]|nr:trigger factor [Clostridia bacterium]